MGNINGRAIGDEAGVSTVFDARYEISTDDRRVEHDFFNLVIPAGGEAPQISLIDPFKESPKTKAAFQKFTQIHGEGTKTEKPSTKMSNLLRTDIDI